MKIALVYDRVNKWGGAERVLLQLHKLFPDAPLYTSVYNPKTALWADVFDVRTSFLQNFPFAKSAHELYAPLMPLAFESFNFDAYDLVISVTSEAAKGIITKPHTKHICYCLTPTRYLWSGYEDYFKSDIKRLLGAPFVWYLRSWDKVAAKRPDALIAISNEVQRRIKTYYDRESEVVYPPVGISNLKYQIFNETQNTKYKMPDTNYFLVVSRLVPYKRIDLAIQACNKLKLPLKIVGTGSEIVRLKSIAGRTIEFVENLTDQELVEYYKKSTALIFSGKEDFGLTIVEAYTQGIPVIAYKSGGALETVIPGKTGEFFDEQTPESLISVLRSFKRKKYQQQEIVQQAAKFSERAFKRQFLKQVEKILAQK